MLVLTRGANEGIEIGDDICIVVLARKGKTIKIGITAPRQVRILRGEVLETELTGEISNSGAGGMLVLSRKANQTIEIGDNITLKVLKLIGSGGRLGLTAPSHILIRRSELPKQAA